MVFLYTGLAQLAFAYPARRIGGRPSSNLALHLSIVLAGAVQLAVLFTPWTRRGLELVPLDTATLLVALVAVVLTWAGAEATSYVMIGHRWTDRNGIGGRSVPSDRNARDAHAPRRMRRKWHEACSITVRKEACHARQTNPRPGRLLRRFAERAR